ncbi:MAG: nucleotidyl transferase AbiEii/AbiGii toxin family protein [Candidatus Magasanikbacteria bacterium]|nr:nucleotidyl transferase AbiEii/AbiGii toxin family protein [Candidatus Magasanikbacteria bacterium]
METVKLSLKELLNKTSAKNVLYQRNVLKEYLQILVLDFLYAHPTYSGLIFYGGSCLAQCYGLPRLSEDLDFVDLKKEVVLINLAEDLKNYFSQKTDLPMRATVQKFRVYLKFPILKELGTAKTGESDDLFLKIEIFSTFDSCPKYKVEIIPLFKFNRTVLIKTFDLSTLMATKIRAILNRSWAKKDVQGNELIKVKGRDYFDLMWYLEKVVKPNLDCLGITQGVLKSKLLKSIERLDKRSIELDLEAFIDNADLIKNLSGSMRDILKRQVALL